MFVFLICIYSIWNPLTDFRKQNVTTAPSRCVNGGNEQMILQCHSRVPMAMDLEQIHWTEKTLTLSQSQQESKWETRGRARRSRCTPHLCLCACESSAKHLINRCGVGCHGEHPVVCFRRIIHIRSDRRERS